MARSGTDEYPWIVVHEMTTKGCSEASASPVGNETAKPPGKAPANNDPSVTEEANSTSGLKSRISPLKFRCDQRTSNISQALDIEELENIAYYELHTPVTSSITMSPGYKKEIFYDIMPDSNVPRSMSNKPSLDAYRFNELSNRSAAEDRRQKLSPRSHSTARSQSTPWPSYQRMIDDENATTRQAVPRNGPTHTQQYSQRVQSPATEYRQSHINQNTEEDAETDEETFPGPGVD